MARWGLMIHPMSAYATKRTFTFIASVSAFRPKADIAQLT